LRPISEAGGPDYLLVTHAHTDHTGALPLVVEQYPHIPVLATRPTIELVRILQADAQRIMQSRQEQEGELPLFDDIAAERLIKAFQPVEFRQPVRLGSNLQVTFHPAGHIVGAALLVIESDEGTLALSGDLSLTGQRTVEGAALPNIKVDALVLESTYGGKLHANRMAEERRLVETLRRIVEQGGKALIPAFALGRAQEVLQILLAYRDQLAVPVYVDGMVRSVCRVYAACAELLPDATVKAAGEDALFFRGQVQPVTTAGQRETVCRSEGPAIIVASSGMLTGGASVTYAKHLAGEARNAILLTGYQDEEAPGRFLQRILERHQAGEEVLLRLDDQSVSLRCALGTYSLSAHADETELITTAEALGAEEVLLVHGDPGARHSLATHLRQRQKHVQTPAMGQVVALDFGTRSWATGQVKSGTETRPLDPARLWASLEAQAGNFYTAGELALLWWGQPDRAHEVVRVLKADPLYFAPEGQQQDLFRVQTAEQVARTRQQRTMMLHHPNLVGQLVVLRAANHRPRAGIVTAASSEAFEARVHNTPETHYPAEALVWVIAPWRNFPIDEEAGRARLSTTVQAARSIQDTLLPPDRRQELVALGKPVQPDHLLPTRLPEGVTREVALLAVVLALAQGGAAWTPEGLVVQQVMVGEALEMNQAREAALALFPPEAQLRKVGLEVARQRLTLTFDFPDVAARQYTEEIEQVAEQTGWEVVVQPQVNQGALGLAVTELLPPGLTVVKGPAFHIAQREVRLEVQGEGDVVALQTAYRERTGFKLVVVRPGETPGSSEPAASPVAAPDPQQARMEINAAYAVIRATLEPGGLYKTSLKGEQIVLSFITPQVADRHRETIAALAHQTGYPLGVNPNPNQQQILLIAQQLLRQAGWAVRKGPGIHVDRAEVAVTLAQAPDPEAADLLNRQFEQQTGYQLVFS
jgi:Cft2 family RNA processing exonuclease